MDRKDTAGGRQQQTGGQRPWRTLGALAVGIVFLVVFALFMVWIGTLVA